MASVLVSMRTPLRSPTTPHVTPASASTIPSIVVSIKPVETQYSGAARLSGVVEAENEFVAELVDSEAIHCFDLEGLDYLVLCFKGGPLLKH